LPSTSTTFTIANSRRTVIWIFSFETNLNTFAIKKYRKYAENNRKSSWIVGQCRAVFRNIDYAKILFYSCLHFSYLGYCSVTQHTFHIHIIAFTYSFFFTLPNVHDYNSGKHLRFDLCYQPEGSYTFSSSGTAILYVLYFIS